MTTYGNQSERGFAADLMNSMPVNRDGFVWKFIEKRYFNCCANWNSNVRTGKLKEIWWTKRKWVIIFKSHYRSYLFIDCDNPSIFSTITKNHIIIFVCYKPYLGFLDMISWLRAILTAPSIVPSRKPSLDHYFRQLDMNCLIGIRHFQFQVDQRSMWGGNLSWFKNILFDFFSLKSFENFLVKMKFEPVLAK